MGGVELGSGSGSSLPAPVLILSGLATLVAVLVSAMSIYLHLKNYRKPALQRMVIRIMIMVPLYAVSSLISLFSLEAAFVIDAIRDIYEAFVIYCFFVLLLTYLGGERSLLILLHGRPPRPPVFPAGLFQKELDVSDPYTFLFLKRGILQYVQVKPILAIATLILKACGKYNEGDLRANSGYLYVSVVYNTSICLSLYCLAVFWICVNDDLKPYRPVPKFLCVKGILFFSFWQSLGISILVAAGAITKLGPYTDRERISLGLTDTLICLEMPLFAIAHMYAFAYTDYIDHNHTYVARMPMLYAFRDAFGLLDVVEDSKATLRGEGMDYRDFEPSEGFMHQGSARERRIRAGLRYSKGGKHKYWLPRPNAETQPPSTFERGVNRAVAAVAGRGQTEEVYAPLLGDAADDVVHLAPDLAEDEEAGLWADPQVEDGYDLPFGEPDPADDELFLHCRQYVFGDYNYPVIDVSSEAARGVMWAEEERVLRDERGAWFSPLRGAQGRTALDQREGPAWEGYGAVGKTVPRRVSGAPVRTSSDRKAPGGGKVIDFAQDRTPPVDPADVRLKWTKSRGGQDSQPASPQGRFDPRGAGSGGSSAESSHGQRLRPPPPPVEISRQSSRASGPHGDGEVLPPDAVDLIVEDHDALQEERTHERRKGEPAMRPALRKVYRRGFVAPDGEGEGEGEVEVEDENGDEDSARRVDVAEDILDAIGDDDLNAEGGVRSPGDDEVFARTVTPPLHARVFVPSTAEDNPWA